MSTTWLYLSTNSQILYHQSSSICMLNHCPKLKILIYTIVSLSEVNIVVWHTLQTCMTPTWYTCYNTGRIQGSMWQGWRYIRWVLCKLWRLLVADSRSKTFAESILYQPWSARCDSVSSIWSRLAQWSLYNSIFRIKSTLLVDWYGIFTLAMWRYSGISTVNMPPQPISQVDVDI